jgi:serine O-acetyltransferase
MIKSKKDYYYYLEADRIALSRKNIGTYDYKAIIKNMIFPDYIWEFQKTLRKLEFIKNTSPSFIDKINYFFVLKKFNRLSYKLGFTIPINVFGPGLSIAHYGTIIVNTGAKVGANCRLHAGVNIGTEAGYSDKAPVLGDNIYIGPGAKLFGAITIADNVAIGANAVVNRTVNTSNVAIGGIPAKKIADIDIDNLLIRATAILKLNIGSDILSGMPAKEVKEFLKRNASNP